MKKYIFPLLMAQFFLISSLWGCSSSTNQSMPMDINTEVTEELKTVFEDVYLNHEVAETLESKLTKQVYDKVTYQVIDSDAEFYEIEVTYPDLGGYLFSQNLDYENMTSEKLINFLLSVLETDNLEIKTEIITVDIVDGYPEINGALTNAYTGGLISALTNSIDEAMMDYIRGVTD